MSWMVRLSLVPDIRHGMSWGTLPYIKLLRAEFGFSLVEAKEIVDRCVFRKCSPCPVLTSPPRSTMRASSRTRRPALRSLVGELPRHEHLAKGGEAGGLREVGGGVDVVELRGLDQAVEDGGDFGAAA